MWGRSLVLSLVVGAAGWTTPRTESRLAQPGASSAIEVVGLSGHPEMATAFGADAATLAAHSATEWSGPHGRGPRPPLRPGDVSLYAVTTRRSDGRRRPVGILAVPVGSVVHPDGSVSPAPASSQPASAVWSSGWGAAQQLNWTYYVRDGGSWFCAPAWGEIRGQWTYARLSGVPWWSPTDYWAVSARADAEITWGSDTCAESIDWFTMRTQSRAPQAVVVAQDPTTGTSGACHVVSESVVATVAGISARLDDHAVACETWQVTGAIAPNASAWYGVDYQHAGRWGITQREVATAEIVAVPAGSWLALNTTLDLDIDHR